MRTIKEVKEILASNRFHWCEPEVAEALDLIADLPDDMTLEEALKMVSVPDEWLFLWAKDVGDRDLMREHIKESEYAFFWAQTIGDKDIMKSRITEEKWLDYWRQEFGDKE